MKPAIAITLIIMGGLLVMTPPMVDYFTRALILQHERITYSSDVGMITGSYGWIFWITGASMIAAAMFGSIVGKIGFKTSDKTTKDNPDSQVVTA
jgi:hypothetical protein